MAENSGSYKNIKIPYPQEGVIRTASLDDTISPPDSAQIGVNVNFDRIGAIQTRKGVEEYAVDEDVPLLEPIKNFGTLNNTLVPAGFESIIKYSPQDVFDSGSANYISSVKVDSTHFLIFWTDSGGLGKAQIAEVDLVTGSFTMKGTALTFEAGANAYNACVAVTSTRYLNCWQGAAGDGFAQVFTVNTTTWSVTAEGSPLEFDTSDASDISITQVDSSHFIIFYATTASVGKADILAVNLSTWAVTEPGSKTTFDGTKGVFNSCQKVDSTHFINFWSGAADDGFVQVVSVNTGTWAITLVGSPLEFDTSNGQYNSSCPLGDGSRFINFWHGPDGGYARIFVVNLGTFAVTAAAAALKFVADASFSNGISNACVTGGDGEHFINFWANVIDSGGGGIADGQAQIFEVDTGTYLISAVGDQLSFGDIKSGSPLTPVLATTNKIMMFWQLDDADSNNGVGSLFRLDGTPVSYNLLYAQQGNGDVLNWPNPGWVVRRTTVNPQQKARFTQYLNRIWMVNGNASFGDPVETSDGGTFDTTLVPDDFPPGDFIQAGFEGRVWVADKLYDVIYFTDIVQFTPPDVYTLSYDPDTNFIKNFSPQNGQTMTGLFTTPRALLLFKQDSIYRIYGAFSVDSYPAYNVGTYSQESIVQTKNGIYFHHSSGFYQFAYDSQPIEISRRVIDFVQAIPRTYYGEVKGIYNNQDAVEWHVGPVEVEGVLYESCVMRYTISTQVWTIYDYKGNDITALILFDDGTEIRMIMGASQI